MLKKNRISEVSQAKIVTKGAVRQWCVPSYSQPGTVHYVSIKGKSFDCTCQHHTFRNEPCAHIAQVRELIQL